MPGPSLDELLDAETLLSPRFLAEKGYAEMFGRFRVRVQCDSDGHFKPFISVRDVANSLKISPYKFRVTVQQEQLPEALRILLPILTSKASPFCYFKVAYIPLLEGDMKDDPYYDRLYKGGQITLYVIFDTINAIKYASGLAAITQLLEEKGIGTGPIPNSDFVISPYFSGRCARSLTETGASSEQYISIDDDDAGPSEDTKQCYLFLLARLFEIIRVAMLPQRKTDAAWEAARQKLIDFEVKYGSDKSIHHHDLIILFIDEVIKPVEGLLKRKIDYSEVEDLLLPKELKPGYNTFDSAAGASTAGILRRLDDGSLPEEESEASVRAVATAAAPAPAASSGASLAAVVDSTGICLAAAPTGNDNGKPAEVEEYQLGDGFAAIRPPSGGCCLPCMPS